MVGFLILSFASETRKRLCPGVGRQTPITATAGSKFSPVLLRVEGVFELSWGRGRDGKLMKSCK